MLSPNDMRKIGQYYWLQLTECKHCGAFETAVEGFTSVCSVLWRSCDDSFPSPVEWLNQILQIIEGKNDTNNLCSTRRSAGLPHLITSILVTEPPNSSNNSVCLAMSSLLEMDGKSLNSRVHSLNVLTSLFSSSLLCERITIALEWACRIAVSKCAANSWLERNAAAQLAAALRARIFGVTRISQRDFHVDSKNRQSTYEFFSRFPSLYPYLLEQLSTSKDEFSVYPILIFLTHIFPSSAPLSVQYSLAPFIPACLRILLWCKAEKLRRLSAAALIAIAREEDINFLLSWIESVTFNGLQQNHVHAIILLLTEALDMDCKSKFSTRIEDFVRQLSASTVYRTWCDFNKSLFFLLCNRLLVEYDVTTGMSDIILAKRPIAQLLLKTKTVLPKEYFLDQNMRRELYRHLQTQETIEDIHKPLIAKSIYDLKTCSTERNACHILEFLYRNVTKLLDGDKYRLCENIVVLLEGNWKLSYTKSLAYRLLGLLSDWKISTAMLEWIESCVDISDEVSKNIALYVGLQGLKKDMTSQLLRVMLRFLQDEDINIREQASYTLSPLLVRNSISLNPEVCYWIAMDKYPNMQESVETCLEVLNAEELYEACASNPYAESRYFGSYTEVITFARSIFNT